MGLAWGINWLATLAVLARIGAALAVLPPFGHSTVPRRVRALIAVALTIGLAPGLNLPTNTLSGAGAVALAIGGEVLIGLAMGLAIGLVFSAAAWAGELIAHQLGLSLSEAYDPATGTGEGMPLARAYGMLVIVVFFAANGHHALLRGLRASFDSVPILSAAANGNAIVAMLTGLLQSATVLALQLAAPAIVATLIADIALGLAARTIPQLGGFAIGLPLRAMTGLLVIVLGVALTVGVLQGAAVNWMQIVHSMIPALGK